MKMRLLFFSIVYSILFALTGCGSNSDAENKKLTNTEENNETKTDKVKLKKSGPTREQFLNDLNFLYRKMSNRKYEEARKYVKVPPSIPTEEIDSQFSSSLENNEISAEGIAILSEKGSFGKLRDIFPEKTDIWLKRSEIEKEEDCFAIKYKQAEVAGIWKGDNFVFFRLDDVGKLALGEEE